MYRGIGFVSLELILVLVVIVEVAVSFLRGRWPDVGVRGDLGRSEAHDILHRVSETEQMRSEFDECFTVCPGLIMKLFFVDRGNSVLESTIAINPWRKMKIMHFNLCFSKTSTHWKGILGDRCLDTCLKIICHRRVRHNVIVPIQHQCKTLLSARLGYQLIPVKFQLFPCHHL